MSYIQPRSPQYKNTLFKLKPQVSSCWYD